MRQLAQPPPDAAIPVQPPDSMLSTGLTPPPEISSPPASRPDPVSPTPAPQTENAAEAKAAAILAAQPMDAATATTLSTGLLPASPAAEPGLVAKKPEPAAQKPASDSKTHTRRLVDDAEKVAQPPARPANARRSTAAVKLFFVQLLLMAAAFIAAGAGLHHYYQQNIEPRLGSSSPTVQSPVAVAGKPSPSDDDTAIRSLKEQLAGVQAKLDAITSRVGDVPVQLPLLTRQLGDAKDEISGLHRQIEVLRAEQKLAENQLAKLEGQPREAAVPAEAGSRPSDLASSLKLSTPAPQNASPDGLALMQELHLLKERNRLTLYADQAIANASSQAMANLWRAVRDPELAFVKDGAVAEIVRVQHFYGMIPGLPPSYHLPVAELFHDSAIHGEADLKDEQITRLLLDQTQPPEVRTRSAILLAGHKDNTVGTALVEAMRQDPNLFVVKAAQNILQQNYEFFAPRLFDSASMEAAWQERLSKTAHPLPADIHVRPPKD